VTFSHVVEAIDLLDAPVWGRDVADVLVGAGLDVEVNSVTGDRGRTDFLTITIPGANGRLAGGDSPTTGIVGRLGGIGARPEAVGLVSDGDGAVAAVAAALALARAASRGDRLPGDVMIGTHVCPEAPTEPHEPVPFMGTPVSMEVMNRWEVRPEMDAVLSIDTTKGNKILNWKGIAITSTVLEGWVLPVAPDLVELYEQVCGVPARVLPLSTYDITPYGNGLYHVNSILQPAVSSGVPTVGVAITAETAVPGSATGASHPADIALAVSFVVEAGKRFGAGRLSFYDEAQYHEALRRYGSMRRLQTGGPEG
jgi:hypothetical protein